MTTATPALLPKGFEDLQKFVPYWAGETNDIRWDRRSSASMDDIRTFYDAMLARTEDVIAYLDPFPLDAPPPEAELLARLMLSLGQAAIAVEMHGMPRTAYSAFPHGIHVATGPWPLGGSRPLQ